MNIEECIDLERARKSNLLRFIRQVYRPTVQRVHELGLTAMQHAIREEEAENIETLTDPFTSITVQYHLLNKFIGRYGDAPTGSDIVSFELELIPLLQFFPQCYSLEWFFYNFTLSMGLNYE